MEVFYRVLIIIACALVGYIVGSIPNSVVIGKLFFHKDPREEGSKNPGGTNAGRVLGRKAGVLVIALDGFKVIIPTYTAFFLFTYCQPLMDLMGHTNEINAFGVGNTLCQLAVYITALGCIVGHCWSIFLGFKGGKAVSTFFGTACGVTYTTFLLCGPIFFGTLKWKKHVSFSSLTSTFAFVIYSWILYIVYAITGTDSIVNYFLYFGQGPSICIYFPIVMTIGFIILYCKHRSNIKRLKEGTESSISWMK